jgi:hypothetical protein
MEAVLPCTAGILTALIFQAWRSQSPARILWPAIVSLLPGFFLSAIVFVWLCLQFKIDFLVHGNWQSMPGSYFMQTYGPSWIRRVGLRVVPAEIGELALECLGAAMFWVAIAWLSCKNRCFVVTAIVLVAAFPTHLFRGLAPGPHAMLSDAASALLFDLSFPRGMFLIAIVFLAISCIRAVCRRYPISAPMLVTIVMAIMLSFRVMVEIYPNGYALFSSPLLLVVFFAALWQTFLFVRQRMAPTSTAVPVFTYFLAYAFLFARAMSWGYYGIDLPLIQTPVGEVRRTQQNEILIDQFLPVVKEAKEKGQKVLLLPELTGLYFVAGILAPNRYELLLPGVLEPGKYTQEMLHELEITRPDLIIISNRRTSNYGVNYFGLDYDRDVLGWIEKNYRNVGEIGHFERSETAPLAGLLFRPK